MKITRRQLRILIEKVLREQTVLVSPTQAQIEKNFEKLAKEPPMLTRLGTDPGEERVQNYPTSTTLKNQARKVMEKLADYDIEGKGGRWNATITVPDKGEVELEVDPSTTMSGEALETMNSSLKLDARTQRARGELSPGKYEITMAIPTRQG